MRLKKIFINSFLLLALLLQTSCVTKYIWGDKSYEEEIEQFLVGADGRSIALIGVNYHYVFSDNSGLLRTFLSLKQKSVLAINSEKTHLKLSDNNDVAGDLVIEGPASILPREDLRLLKSLGFMPDRKDIISIKIKLVGRRYAPRFLGQGASRLNEFYTLQIYYSDSNLAKDVGKAAVTPIAVTLDAAILIGKVVFYPFSL
ncbi:MAG: hypothetical protein EBS06_01960 [Proteobacteria bacterium]|nr:hypothetical protein [Pseudomonadota bacterium]